MSKSLKIWLSIILVIIIGGILFIYNGFNGNPISKMMAKDSAKNYLAENYSERDFIIDDVFYNFKDGRYHAVIKSPSSIDTHFTLEYEGRELRYNSYEDLVLSGWNTLQRIDDEYRKMVESVFDSKNFPLVSEIDFGEIALLESVTLEGSNVPKYGVKLDELELDKVYDIKKLAEENGHIIYYAQHNEVSYEKMAELLMILKNELDDANIPFFAVDFILEKERLKENIPPADRSNLRIEHFLYSDIYEERLVERLEESATALLEHYEQEDREINK